MSTLALASRSAGQVILDSFFNDLKSILSTDFVGRDVNGNPVSGNNLGNSAYPWGSLYCTQAIIGGVSLNLSSLERPPYQIISGAVRAGSNQPAFVKPAGGAATFSLLATAVNLVLSINGVAVTWTADQIGIAVTTAPASNNTCTVNDATAAAQAATRTWGEYGSGSPYYAITVSAMGTSISNRVGTWQAFKVGTEYFVAYIDSTTSLTRAFRGYFFDSSGNPVKRATFSNSATITLMNLGYVFADSNGSTVDVIFTGGGVNSAPTFAFTAPGAPASGDYWFDEGNQVWKRWSGAAWVIVTRILVGLVVADVTNCVAARSFDYYGLCRADNTVELAWVSNTVLKSNGLFERVNVNGKNILLGTSRMVWDTASNLAASTDRYNATVQASTAEYFYVTDQGDTKISDMEPCWRPDLLGWYHPYNPWRQVALDYTDGSGNFQSGTVINRGSSTKPPVSPVVSQSCGSFGITATTYADITNLSVQVSSQGESVQVSIQGDGTGGPAIEVTSASGTLSFRILRGSTVIASYSYNVNTGTDFLYCGGYTMTDTPPPGNYIYKVQAQQANAGGANGGKITSAVLAAQPFRS